MNFLEKFYYLPVRFYLKFKEDTVLPAYKGTTLRGGFGYSLKRLYCIAKAKENCSECILRFKCVYAYFFKTFISEDAKIMRRYREAPHPFIIEPDFELKKEYKKDEIIKFNFTLLGKAIDFLPYSVFAFEKLGEKGLGKKKSKFEILKITFNTNETEIEIYSTGKKLITPKPLNFKPDFPNEINKLKITFQTPTRLKYKGKIVELPEFHIIIRNLLRRISEIFYFHFNEELNFNPKKIIDDALKIKIISHKIKKFRFKRYSTSQHQKINLDGIIGEVLYEGELYEFIPLIELGSIIHIGKNTTFGLGKYNFEFC